MIYVTSDLHGCSVERFRALLARAEFSEDDFLFVLGDVIDRGEHGAELLLWLSQQPNISLILGNHEALLLACAFLFEEVTEESLSRLTAQQLGLVSNCLANGGGPTLAGLRRLLKEDEELLWAIVEDLRDAPLYEIVEAAGRQYVLVHAGLGNFRPDKPLEDYTPEELLMVRPGPEQRYYENATVIFGHTPTAFYGAEGKTFKTPTWICIDTGRPTLLRLEDLREFC